MRYVEQLRRYHAHFPHEQVLVLIYDDLRRDNEATVRRVLRFLGVDDTLAIAASEANPTVRMRSQQLEDSVESILELNGALRDSEVHARAVLQHVAQGIVTATAPLATERRNSSIALSRCCSGTTATALSRSGE